MSIAKYENHSDIPTIDNIAPIVVACLEPLLLKFKEMGWPKISNFLSLFDISFIYKYNL
jgi:hypothetical protein